MGAFELSSEIADKLIRIIIAIPIYSNRYIKSEDCDNFKSIISERQFSILQALKFGRKNTISELSELMKISKSTMSIVMKKLIEKGYVYKDEPSGAEDKRKTYFFISDSGIEILEKIRQKKKSNFEVMYAQMNKKQKQNFKKAIKCFWDIENKQDSSFEISDADFEQKIHEDSVFFMEFMLNTYNVINSIFSDSILTKYQFFLLICISKYEINTISRLEEFLHTSVSSLSITISKLASKNLVIKEAPKSSEDGRVIYLSLTQYGKETLDIYTEKTREVFFNFVNTLSSEKKKLLNKGLDYLIEVFKQ